MSAHAQHESLIGQDIDALDTPAMVVDLDPLEENLRRMADYFTGRHCRIRPHFKSHKCVELARRQLAAGNACGITCAKLSEAEQLVIGGVDDVLIANQVIGERKAARLATLNQSATVRCAVDSVEGIGQLNRQAEASGTIIPVLVEVDIGMHRCGVAPGESTLELARKVCDHEHLRFDGLQGYEGHLVMIVDPAERRQKTLEEMELLIETRRRIEQSGIEVPIVSGGSSSTYDITGNVDGIDEIQCGSYALMDWSYQQRRPEFQISRWILATVMSRGTTVSSSTWGSKALPAILARRQYKVIRMRRFDTRPRNTFRWIASQPRLATKCVWSHPMAAQPVVCIAKCGLLATT